MEKINNVLQNVTNEDLEILQNNPEKFWQGVEKIGKSAFANLLGLTSIKIPNSVVDIDNFAFYNCKNLKNVEIPKSVNNIGTYAFACCEKLLKVDGLNSSNIGDFAFFSCSNLQSLNILDGVKDIGEYVFKDCLSLTSINIPKGVESIGKYAFANCSNLENITIPENITKINSGTFSDCSSITNINIPQSVKFIDDYAFYKCSMITSVNIPDGVTNIGAGVFKDCLLLNNINIPKSVNIIGKQAFANCMLLDDIKIPEGVVNIQDGTFFNCSRLLNINIPQSVENIGKDAFYNCSSLTNINIPESVTSIGEYAFASCLSLTNISIPPKVEKIKEGLFYNCENLQCINIPQSVTNIGDYSFTSCKNLTSINISKNIKTIGKEAFKNINLKHVYYEKISEEIVLSSKTEEELEKHCLSEEYTEKTFEMLQNKNFRDNYFKLKIAKNVGKIKFIPPAYTLKIFPNDQIKNYFINRNNKRWQQLVKTIGFDTLNENEKENSLTDLMKIYYAIGGFSNNQGESEKAYDYILNHVAVLKNTWYSPEKIGEEIHRRFSKLALKGEYNKVFAQFFMKYYKNNPDFMVFALKNQENGFDYEKDYLCEAHNSFGEIMKNYPNKTVNGNEERSLLTPKFVAEHCYDIVYEKIDDGNEILARTIGKYGYSQEQFERIQEIYNKAKKIKDKFVIQADKSFAKNGITFRVLEKDDPLGFVIGDITNCCQHIDGAGESCVDDGYTNPEAGFMLFEKSIIDKDGNPTGEVQILGQAYIWYDPQTKTVCLDNIEVPTKVLKELKKQNNDMGLSTKELIEAVKQSAYSIMHKMNENGVNVERVTTGKGYNDLKEELSKYFKIETSPCAKHRNYSGYSDAKDAQFIIATYDQKTKEMSEKIKKILEKSKEEIKEMQCNKNCCEVDYENER